jgi:hypothetical protein
MTLPKLEIHGGALARGSKVKLNGWEVPGLTSVTFQMDTHSVNRVTLEISVGSVEVDAETVTELIAAYDPAAGVSKLP